MAQYIKVVQNISRIEINWRRFPFYEECLIRFYDNVVGFIDAREKFFFYKENSIEKSAALFSRCRVVFVDFLVK